MKILILVLFALSSNLWASCQGLVSEKSDVTVRLYEPKTPASRLVVILPPTGGENKADRKLAFTLCASGFLVKVVDYPQPVVEAPDFEGHERVTKLIMNVFSAFLAKETLPTTVVGASLGGIYAGLIYSLAIGNDPMWDNFNRIDSLVATVAGGPLPAVLATSSEKTVQRVRGERLATGRFSNLDEYRSYLDSLIFLDTMKLLNTNHQVLFFGSTNDVVVPTSTQKTLSEGLAGETYWINRLGHSGTVAFVYYRRGGMIARFLKNLP